MMAAPPRAFSAVIFHRGLHRQVDGKLQGFGPLRGVAQAGVHRLLDAGGADDFGRMHALGPEGIAAEDMRQQRAVRVKPHLARAEQQAGVADLMHLLHLLGRPHLADPDEAAAIGEAALQGGGVEIGEDRGQRFRRAFGVHHVGGMGVKRVGRHVGRKDAAVQVHDIGALRDDLGPGGRGHGFDGFRGRKMAHTHADQHEEGSKAGRHQAKTRSGAGMRALVHRLMAVVEVLAFDQVGIGALGAGLKDAGKRAKRRAHVKAPLRRRRPQWPRPDRRTCPRPR